MLENGFTDSPRNSLYGEDLGILWLLMRLAKMHGLSAYVRSTVDVDSVKILAVYASQSRNTLTAMKFLRMDLGRCLNKPLILVDKRLST